MSLVSQVDGMWVVFEYLSAVLSAIGHGLTLDPALFQGVQAGTMSFAVCVGVAVVGGASLLLGHSVVLFASRVKPVGFVLALGLNGLLYTVGLLVWATATWLVAAWWFPGSLTFDATARIIMLASAPLAFGFLGLMPYFGPPVLRLLQTWSLLETVRIIAYECSGHWTEALLVVGLGWLLVVIASHTIGHPVVALRSWFWKKFFGFSPDESVQQIVQEYLVLKPAEGEREITP